MRVSVIAAVAENRVIGKNNDLAWHLPDDLKFFKETTKGRTVVMGRKNYESIPHKYRPLPGRPNVILTTNPDYKAERCTVFTDLNTALREIEREGETHCFIIGGGEIYRLALEKNVADDMYITQVHAAVEGDTFFPKTDGEKWQEEIISVHEADEKHAYPFTVKHYKKRAASK